MVLPDPRVTCAVLVTCFIKAKLEKVQRQTTKASKVNWTRALLNRAGWEDKDDEG